MKHTLINYPSIEEVFTPEQFDETNEMIAKTSEKFAVEKVLPVLSLLNDKKFDVVRSLMIEAGELGLIGAGIAEEDGGLDLGKVNETLISEMMAYGHSFSITFGGQTGIGALPIAYFGNKEQKEKYLPSILSGEKIVAYALTESTSGTDALSLKTTAELDNTGDFYILQGEKQWITNAGFADIFIVFAKLASGVTAFIVDANSGGISTSNEEMKMGLDGSSTRSVYLDNVKVPKENIIGEIGKGHRIAFNVLNIGRHKISATSLGSAKRSLQLALQYGNERKQFKQTLTQFELIKHKIAKMGSLIYVVESTLYRIAHDMQEKIAKKQFEQSYGDVIAPFAAKCSLSKIIATESLAYVVDEALQIHGGYGFMKEYEIENIYRDVRINRIFEGTNEINRIILATSVMEGQYETTLLQHELEGGNITACLDQLTSMKEIFVKTIVHFQQLGITNMHKHQTVAQFIANTIVFIYASESAVLRSIKAITLCDDPSLQEKYTMYFMESMKATIVQEALIMLSEYPNEACEAEWLTLLSKKQLPMISMQNDIAERLIEKERYVC